MSTTTKQRIETPQFITPAQGIRIDKYVTEVLHRFSRNYIQKLIEQGHVLVNDQRAKAGQKLVETDKVTIELPVPIRPIPEPMPLSILYEDKDILVISKPPGLTVHPAKSHPNHTLVNAILAHCPSLTLSSDLVRPGIVHRLDKDTSGLMVIAKNDFAQHYLIEQFKNHKITKGYLVLVKGRLSPEKGTIKASIGRDPRHRTKMTIVEEGKTASTEYQVKKYLNDYSLLEVNPRTGRMHQIRVHMSAIGYPVLGDPIYGANYRTEALAIGLKRQFIHAHRLGFRLPSTNQYREFTCPLPPDLEQVLRILEDKN